MTTLTAPSPLPAPAQRVDDPKQYLLRAFQPHVDAATRLIEEAKGVKVTSPDQKDAIAKSGELRKRLKAVRLEAEKTRVAMKADALEIGKFIDQLSRSFLAMVEPEERRLEEQEKIAERQEQARKDKLRAERAAALAPFGVDPSFYQLGDMPAEQFDKLLESSRIAHENAQAAAKRQEEERAAQEKAQQEEQARVRAENEKLRREAQEREAAAAAERKKLADEQAAKDAAARKEREKLEAQARQEREAREKLEREQQEREAAEKRRQQDEAKAQRKAARAPDKAKLMAVAQAVREIPTPQLRSEEAAVVERRIRNMLNTTAAAIEDLIRTQLDA